MLVYEIESEYSPYDVTDDHVLQTDFFSDTYYVIENIEDTPEGRTFLMLSRTGIGRIMTIDEYRNLIKELELVQALGSLLELGIEICKSEL